MNGQVVFDTDLGRRYEYAYSDGNDETDNDVEIEMCFADRSIYTIATMMVPNLEFRVQISGVDSLGNSFVRLDPGVYSPARLEVEIGKVSDQVLTTDSSVWFKSSDMAIYLDNRAKDAARYEFSAFCEDDRVSVNAWYNGDNEDADDEDADSSTSMFCQSNAPASTQTKEGYVPGGLCYFNMDIQAGIISLYNLYLICVFSNMSSLLIIIERTYTVLVKLSKSDFINPFNPGRLRRDVDHMLFGRHLTRRVRLRHIRRYRARRARRMPHSICSR